MPSGPTGSAQPHRVPWAPAIWRGLLWLALALAAPWAAAQASADRGEWQILEARYGTAQRNIDVTARLRELARRDTSFRVTNEQFGSDPHPGVVKTLRIYARSRSGATQVFEYPEGGVGQGTQFVGWSEGQWGQGNPGGGWGGQDAPAGHADAGQWRILRALYGTYQHHVDVTARLRELSRSDNLFAVSNANLGGDPHPGVVKTLRIHARNAAGATRTFEYGEDQMVDGAAFTSWRGGEWGQGGWEGGWGHFAGGGAAHGSVTVVSAQYGEGRDRIDVTERLRAQVRDGRLQLRVTNDNMGRDPAPNRPKFLWLTYVVGGSEQRQVRVVEGQSLAVP